MPFNDNYEYEPSEQFKIDLKKWLSQHFSDTNTCKGKEYDEIFDLLCGMEDEFFKQYQISNNDSKLTFEEKRDKLAEDLKRFAFQHILEKLCKLKKKRNKYNSKEEDEGWTKCETNVNKIATMIWKIWCHEREYRPRAGIIPLYYDQSGAAEILVTKYKKNNYIQYGFAKGKIEFWEDIWTCAAREGAEELGLDADWIYDQIQNRSPIKKNVLNVVDNSLIEHYYFIIPVHSKDMVLKLNEEEIEDVEWHNVYTIPCCNNCPGKQLIQSTICSRASNYFMVNCSDGCNRNLLILDVLMYIDKINRNQIASQKYKTIHRLCRHN